MSCLLLASVALVFEPWVWLEIAGEQATVRVVAPINVKAINLVLVKIACIDIRIAYENEIKMKYVVFTLSSQQFPS